MPKISFITSCYNAEQFLDELIDNLSHQTEEDYEHIIVDSASSDASVSLIKKWQDKNKRVKLIEQPERTPYGVSWLLGWQAAQAPLVSNSNADDRSHPWRATQVIMAHDKLKRMDGILRQECNRFYYGGYETWQNGQKIAWGVPPEFSIDDMSQFFRCGVHIHWDDKIRKHVDWNLMMKAGMEYKSAFDYWFILYFMAIGIKGKAIPNCFSIYNQRADSVEQSDKERNTFESLRAIETFFPESIAITNLHTKSKIESPEFYQRYLEFKNSYE